MPAILQVGQKSLAQNIEIKLIGATALIGKCAGAIGNVGVDLDLVV
jgi:hypothetical protein